MIKCPTCPMCDRPPSLMVSVEQVFCDNEDCPTFCWDMTQTKAELRRNTVVHDLSHLFGHPRSEPGA